MGLLQDLQLINDLLGTHVTLFEQLAKAQASITQSSIVLLDAQGRQRDFPGSATTSDPANRAGGVRTIGSGGGGGGGGSFLTAEQAAQQNRQLVDAINGVRTAIDRGNRVGGGSSGGAAGGAVARASGLI